jgi:RNA polymerase sigma-70 factor (ECF subfamily)
MDDETLVQRCLQGDHGAFGELVSRYERPLFNAALRMLRDREEARDATQNAFVKAWQHLDQFDRSRRFFSWLYRIALNESLNRATRRKKSEPLDERLVDRGMSPAEGAERSEQSLLIERAVDQLSESYREVIVLRHWLDLSYEEIAEALHVPAKTVKSRLFSARARLGEILATMGVGTA